MSAMSKGEREDLLRLVRQREKVLKTAAKQRSAELMADFKDQLLAVYQPEDDPVWKELTKTATEQVARANRALAARCHELGVLDEFAPSLRIDWEHRGWGNAVEKRRQELLFLAQAKIDAIEAKAKTDIERHSVETQTRIVSAGLSSEAAIAFLNELPAIEALMPTLSLGDVAPGKDRPSPLEMLTANAVRQQRYRDTQKALRNGQKALRNADNNAIANGGDAPSAKIDIEDLIPPEGDAHE